MRIMVAVGARHSLVKRESSCLVNPRAKPSEKRAKTTEIKSAIISLPINSLKTVNPLVASGSTMFAMDPISIRMTGSRIVNNVMPNPGKLMFFLDENCSASSAGGSV
ncbi:hypothetical protein D3C75_956350 [compost metagenome]